MRSHGIPIHQILEEVTFLVVPLVNILEVKGMAKPCPSYFFEEGQQVPCTLDAHRTDVPHQWENTVYDKDGMIRGRVDAKKPPAPKN